MVSGSMHNRNILITKWPFCDFLLVALAGVIIHLSSNPIQIWQAWLAWDVSRGHGSECSPFSRNIKRSKLSETTSGRQAGPVQTSMDRRSDRGATSQWQSVQEQAARTSRLQRR